MERELKGFWELSSPWWGRDPERNEGSKYRVLGRQMLEASKSPSASLAEERRDWQVELDFGVPGEPG